jgi:hypothetical protein
MSRGAAPFSGYLLGIGAPQIMLIAASVGGRSRLPTIQVSVRAFFLDNSDGSVKNAMRSLSKTLHWSVQMGSFGTTNSGLTNRWSGRVRDKVPSSNIGARAAQLNR